jgi:adenylosuccinate synthase
LDTLDSPRVIVVDLGFGDAGKGTITDWLVRSLGARAVVRFNGGAQAGHNVVTEDGRHHTFAQLGAATFVPGVRTFLSKRVVFHPTALLVEADHLARVGVHDALDRIIVSEECLVTTPIHQAATCVRELARGGARHGSCGVGVGETMRDAIARPGDAICAGNLRDPALLLRWLERLQENKRDELAAELRALPQGELADAQRMALEDRSVMERWVRETRAVADRPIVQDDGALHAVLGAPEPVVLEGAQGVLLDEWAGFHPFTTWSTCTFQNALDLLGEHGSAGETFRLGVLRSFATRHGAGPFPTESADLPEGRTREHNGLGPWQGRFRTGWFDAVLARYALEACGGADGLALTHLDRFGAGVPWRVANAYDLPHKFDALVVRAASGRVRGLRLGVHRDLGHTEQLGEALFAAQPVYEAAHETGGVEPDVATAVERLVGAPVILTSHGPTADDKQLIGSGFSVGAHKYSLTGREASRDSGRVPSQHYCAEKPHNTPCVSGGWR